MNNATVALVLYPEMAETIDGELGWSDNDGYEFDLKGLSALHDRAFIVGFLRYVADQFEQADEDDLRTEDD
jgi:hypothetical protein